MEALTVVDPRRRYVARAKDRLAAGRTFVGAVAVRPGGTFALVTVGALVLVAIAGPLLAPDNPYSPDVSHRLEGPSAQHLLGTDQLGRDLLSRLIMGLRVEFSVALPSVCAAALLGLSLGLAAGYMGGRVDNVLIVVMDTIQAFPAVVLALALLAVLGPSVGNLIVVIAIALSPNYARVSRALALKTKEEQFVEAERSLGAGHARIVLTHLLPNIVAPMFILFAFDIPGAIALEAGFSFLGLGVAPPKPSWGVMLADGFTYVRESPWAVLWTSLALMLATLAFTMLGEALRDAIDPKIAAVRTWRRSR